MYHATSASVQHKVSSVVSLAACWCIHRDDCWSQYECRLRHISLHFTSKNHDITHQLGPSTTQLVCCHYELEITTTKWWQAQQTSPHAALYGAATWQTEWDDSTAWLCGKVVERWSLTGELSLSCTRPTVDGWPLVWVNCPSYINE